MHTRFTRPLLLFFVVALSGLTSCLPEQKIARTFINARNVFSLEVTPPALIFKYNHKGEEIGGFDTLTDQQKDSALWDHSHFMRRLSDSLMLELYVNNFIGELRDLGFNVYIGPTDDTAFTNSSQSYTLDIAQLQLDEYLYPYEDEETISDTTYIKRINLNAIDFSTWFELRKAGSKNRNKRVLYSTSTIYDSFDGRYFTDMFTSSVRYTYSIDTISVQDIYNGMSYLGQKHAGYLYDFFMNQYISQNMPQGLIPIDYFHYNRKRNIVTPAGDEVFELLDTK